jgi:hypothetical protein
MNKKTKCTLQQLMVDLPRKEDLMSLQRGKFGTDLINQIEDLVLGN